MGRETSSSEAMALLDCPSDAARATFALSTTFCGVFGARINRRSSAAYLTIGAICCI